MIDHLEPNQIFVFGSNLAGDHAGGAARQARTDFGAVDGVGEGLTGYSYAFPTLDENFERLSHEVLIQSRDVFYRCANAHQHLQFLMTSVGTGIAGYQESSMKELFKDLPENVIAPKEWVKSHHEVF